MPLEKPLEPLRETWASRSRGSRRLHGAARHPHKNNYPQNRKKPTTKHIQQNLNKSNKNAKQTTTNKKHKRSKHLNKSKTKNKTIKQQLQQINKIMGAGRPVQPPTWLWPSTRRVYPSCCCSAFACALLPRNVAARRCCL